MAVFRFGEQVWNTAEHTYVMGILNVTPDSFSDGGRYLDPEAAAARAAAMTAQGADLLDVGGQSTRPGHIPVPPEEEWARIAPVLERLAGTAPLSVDTASPAVAERAVRAGAAVINDESGDPRGEMTALAARTGAGLVRMFPGRGADDDGGDGDPVAAVREWFRRALEDAAAAGLPPERLCLDPGIGFGRDREGDLAVIARLDELTDGLPAAMLVGASRKRVIAHAAGPFAGGSAPEDRLAGTVALHTLAQWNGARILRVHDVAEAVQAARVVDTALRLRR